MKNKYMHVGMIIFLSQLLYAAPQITINSPVGGVSTENSVDVNASIVDTLSTYGFVDWADSLMGWWRGEGNANDESRYADHGTFGGDAHIVDNGKFGKAFSFDGSGDSVRLGDTDILDFSKKDSFTLSVWVHKVDDQQMDILRKTRYFRLFYHGSKRWQFSLGDTDKAVHIYAAEPDPSNKWIHLAVVYDAQEQTLKMYVDSGLKMTRSNVNELMNDFLNSNQFKLGAGIYAEVYYRGMIDDALIFKRALREVEVQALYAVRNNSLKATYSDLTELTTYSFSVHAVNDSAERTDTSTRTIFVDVPNTKPNVVLVSPQHNTRMDSPQQTFTCSVVNTNRDTDLQSVSFYWDYPGSFVQHETKQVQGDSVTVEFTITNLTEKTFEWNCYAQDTNGNGAFASENYTYHAGRAEFYVAMNGDDANAGTIDEPFRTVQKAADSALPGDTIFIRAGTYRETVIPPVSGNATAPVIFKAYPGEQAVISGADVIQPSWVQDKGFIYKTRMDWDMGLGKNQIFVDGEAMIEARWPDTDDISVPKFINTESGSYYQDRVAYLNSSSLDQPAGYWDGAIVHAIWGARYHAITGEVTSSSPGKLVLDLHSMPYWNITSGIFYITCSYNALDKAGEWFYDSNDSTLYLWTPSGSSPLQHTVEAKRRNVAFDLNGKSYINIEDLKIFSANITTDPESHHIVIDNCIMKYISHYTLIDVGRMGVGEKGVRDSGIILDGHDNSIQNSYIGYSAGNGVALIGNNNTVHNCTIHDVNYVVTDCAAVHLGGRETANNSITHCRLYNTGRELISHSWAKNLKILHNEMFNNRRGTEPWDMGATYMIATSAGGTEIAYNYIHDIRSIGIYLDGGPTSGCNIHHNVIWNIGYTKVDIALHMNLPATSHKIYNNTFVDSYISTNHIHDTLAKTMEGTEIKNNICAGFRGSFPDAIVDHNLTTGTTDALFVDKENLDFRLQPGSPAIDAGVDVGFTHDVIGNPIVNTPDMGAYEYYSQGSGNQNLTALFSIHKQKTASSVYSVTFNALQSYDTDGLIMNYAWDFGDGNTMEGYDYVYVTHEYEEKGSYQVTLTVTDNAGNKASQTQTVTVGDIAIDDGDDTNEFELYAVNVHGNMRKNEIVQIQGKAEPGALIYAVRILDEKGNVLNINFDHAVTIDAEGNIIGNIPIIEIIKKYPLLTSFNVEVVIESGGVRLTAQTGLIMLAPFETKIACYNNIIMPSKGITEAIVHVELAENAHVSVVIYDSQGREVKVAMDEDKIPGTYVIRWDGTKEGGSKVGSGIYIIHMKAGGYTKTKKIAVVK